MASNKNIKKRMCRIGPNISIVVILGIVLGYLISRFSNEVFARPVEMQVVFYAIGLVWSFIGIEWILLLLDFISFRKDPLPVDLNLSARLDAQTQSDKITGTGPLTYRAFILLQAWAEGASPATLFSLASAQNRRAVGSTLISGAFVLLILVPCIWFDNNSHLIAWLPFLILAVTLYVRFIFLSRVEQYIETRLLTRLPADLPGTTISANELGTILGQAIDSAFRNYIPQPDKMAESIRTAVQELSQHSSKEIEKNESAFATHLESMFSEWTKSSKETAEMLKQTQLVLTGGWNTSAQKATKQLETAQQTMAEQWSKVTDGVSGQLETVQQKMTDQWGSATNSITEQLQSIQESFSKLSSELSSGIHGETELLIEATRSEAEKISQAGGSWKEQLETVLNEHVDKIEKATSALGAQLGQIMALQNDVKQVLHIQEMVDGTIKAVSTTDEFQQLIKGLRIHLEESDKLLREVSKPRTIRLVETDHDEFQATEITTD